MTSVRVPDLAVLNTNRPGTMFELTVPSTSPDICAAPSAISVPSEPHHLIEPITSLFAVAV